MPKILVGVVALLFCLWILNFFVLPIKNTFYDLSLPIQKAFWNAGVSSSSFLGSLFNGVYLSNENENLKQENQKLLSQVLALQSITHGNQALSDVSATCQNADFKLLMVGIIGLDENDVLSINKGLLDGIVEGMPVINQQGVIFGKIFKVYKNFSQVILVSNKSSVINVKVQKDNIDAQDIYGVVKGSGGLNAYLDLVSISNNVSSGDIIVTSAIEKYFPKDLLVAKIIYNDRNDQEPFQQAQISLFLDIKNVDNLFVITNYKR